MKSILLRKSSGSESKCSYKNLKSNIKFFKKSWDKSDTYPTSSYIASESCLGFIFSAPARLSAADCCTIEIISLRNSSCIYFPCSE